MSLDPHHVHNFWGASPALDVREVVARCGAGEGGVASSAAPGDAEPLRALLVGASDVRHVFTTLARSRRHLPHRHVHFYVHEPTMVETARHVLLLCVLMTDDLPPTDRMERFLEIFMNATVRDSTAELIERHAQRLERVVGAIFAGEADDPEIASDPVARVFDFSLLKFKEKDELMDCIRSWSRRVPFDMELARDRRLRKYYDERFDVRKNIVDWDYHMRVEPAGGGIIHFKHFAQWRLAGIGYPVREATYPAPNRTLVGYARGTTKEFKDRNLDDKGRTVESRGFWGDVLNGPYHSFGTRAEEPSLFKVANRQHVKNAVEVCEYNVAANLYEMRAGKPWRAGNGDAGADAINAWMPEEGVTPEDGEGADGSGAWEGRDGEIFDDAWRRLRVVVVGPENFEKNFASRGKHAALFDAIVVGAWSAQRVTPALGATAKPGATLAVEGGKHFVAMDAKAAVEFAGKVADLAVAAGFAPVPPSAPETTPAPAPERDPDEIPDGRKPQTRATGPGVVPELDDAFRFFVKSAATHDEAAAREYE